MVRNPMIAGPGGSNYIFRHNRSVSAQLTAVWSLSSGDFTDDKNSKLLLLPLWPSNLIYFFLDTTGYFQSF